MKTFHSLFALLGAALCTTALAETATVTSPDGKLQVTFNDRFGGISYSVSYDGIQALRPSRLGLVTNVSDLSQGMKIASSEADHITSDYTLTRSKQSQVHYDANTLTLTLRNDRGEELQVEWRVSNNDIAMRYLLPKQGETGSVRVTSEATSYAFPDGTTTFLTPQSDAMIGWKRTKPSYEEPYTWDAPMNQASDYGHGYTFPALFHVQHLSQSMKAQKVEDELWVLLSETGVDSHYCASHLSDVRMGNTYTIAYPMAEENNGIGTTDAAIQLPGVTPWRTITVGRTMKPIAETTAPWDNVEPLYEASTQFQPGRGTWSWILWQDESINLTDLSKYVDLSKAMGYEYVLVDNWWDTNLPKREESKNGNAKGNIEDLIEYAHSQGIDVWLW